MPREVGGDEDDLGIVGDQLLVFLSVLVDDSCTRNFNDVLLILVAGSEIPMISAVLVR